jgi:hypothetical protein
VLAAEKLKGNMTLLQTCEQHKLILLATLTRSTQ